MPKEKKTESPQNAKRKRAPKRTVAREIRRRAEPPIMLVWAGDETHLYVPLCRELGWRVLNLHLYGGAIPSGMSLQGAFLGGMADAPVDRQLRTLGCQVVWVAPLPPPDGNLRPAIGLDRPASGRLAAKHFAERGFRHVGFASYGEETHRAMFEAFRDHAGALECECHSLTFRRLTRKEKALPPHEKADLRRQELMEWFKRVPKPIAMLGYSATFAGRLCVAAQEAGFDIPTQIALLALGDPPWVCESAPVPLSAIDTGPEQRAKVAVDLMQKLLAGKPTPAEAVLMPPVGIVERQSTDVLAVADPTVAGALRVMWDHLDLDLSVDDVAHEVGVPRHRLERAFRAHLKRGVNEELRRRRLEVFREKLLSTDLPISELAPSVGFRTMVHLQRSFRRAYGMSPRQCRKQGGGEVQ
ncbi:MAG: substrate-binding domain-containing protein [Verrucomicrobia bacterium]|jgi:LacI family transcriptional regulator|nr:substrate-binding domain-containing protein [Verrucomicrobiota bacterium]MBT7066452.1 substrate-binding domain-containing protein [Verrucomicrobiota bacterium]MBT7700642.1 substrate-binding domain-containing protein [Verrucomicrobiota bacterium]